MANKIVRTPTRAEGGLTPEEQELMKDHTTKWIARAMRTEPINPEKIVPAIKALYAAAKLKEPRVVIVPSPRIMALAGGFAAAIWWLRKNPKNKLFADATYDATYDATDGATYAATRGATAAATRGATYDATDDATAAATYDATRGATYDATAAATDGATYAATDAATRGATAGATAAATDDATADATRGATYGATAAATYDATADATAGATAAATRDATYGATAAATAGATAAATDDATDDATDAKKEGLVKFFLSCARRWAYCYQGGNMWPAWDCYLTAARDILGLQLKPHSGYAAWERCAIEGGFRWMHEEFCIVSDFPEILKVDDQNRPHCDDGPSHRWRDGWELWHIHGVKVTRQIVVAPESLTIAQVRGEENAEVRRVMIERMGWEKFCAGAKLRVIHKDTLTAHFPALPVSETVHADMRMVTSYRQGTEVAELLESEEFKDFDDRPLKFVRVTDPSTGEHYTLRVWPSNKRAYEAIAQTFGLTETEYRESVHTHS